MKMNKDGTMGGKVDGKVVFRVPELRDMMAMAALTSMLSPIQDIRDGTYAMAAELSYRFADAMLEARKQ
jgi:hypothetical protein